MAEECYSFLSEVIGGCYLAVFRAIEFPYAADVHVIQQHKCESSAGRVAHRHSKLGAMQISHIRVTNWALVKPTKSLLGEELHFDASPWLYQWSRPISNDIKPVLKPNLRIC